MAKPFLIRQIPNMLTLSNLALGCVGLVLAGRGELQTAALCMGGDMVADFFDGFSASVLKVSSPIGGDLDSLADMVTFGVLPGMLMYRMLAEAALDSVWPWAALVLPLAAAVRLAVFNNDDTQADGFKGVPTPLSALVIGSLPFIQQDYPDGFTPWVLVSIALVLSALMVSRLPMLALKFKTFAFKANAVKYIFLLLSALSLVFLHFLAVPVIFGLYLILSFVNRSPNG